MNDVFFHKIWWLWVPTGFLLLQILFECLLPYHYLDWYISEQGPVELAQSMIMFIGFFAALLILKKLDFKKDKWLALWVATAALGCFYIAFEEISWGQQLLHWTTPAEWAAINDQNETNLHNTSSWLDQKPRMLLEIGILVGGIIIPALRHFKPQFVPQRFTVLYPTDQLFVIAIIALGVKLADHIDKGLNDIVLFERGSEIVEIYAFYFVMMYLLMLRKRILQDER